MALSSISLLPQRSVNKITSSKLSDKNTTSFHVSSKPSSVSCQYNTEKGKPGTGDQLFYLEPKKWRNLVSTALAAAAVASSSFNIPAIADLNRFEAKTRGEFGIGSAAQYGSADLKKAVHVNEDFSCRYEGIGLQWFNFQWCIS